MSTHQWVNLCLSLIALLINIAVTIWIWVERRHG